MTKVQRRGILKGISRRDKPVEAYMEIRKITSCKKDYLPLLLLGDEQESMIDRYLERGTLYALFDEGDVYKRQTIYSIGALTREYP